MPYETSAISIPSSSEYASNIVYFIVHVSLPHSSIRQWSLLLNDDSLSGLGKNHFKFDISYSCKSHN